MSYAYARPAEADVKSLQKHVSAGPVGETDSARGQGLIPGVDRRPSLKWTLTGTGPVLESGALPGES